jgi:transaldolase
MNPLQQLKTLGQSVWLDYIRRDLMTSGKLHGLIEEDGLSGITSNPTIFEKAMAQSGEYDEQIKNLLRSDPDTTVESVFERVEVRDIQMAADEFLPVFEQTKGADGFASIEVSPRVAYDAEESIAHARRLWREVKRPNLMVKIPATPQGMHAIEILTRDGINVNVTLIFSLSQYTASANAYLRGLRENSNPSKVSSVASFFVSRVDTAVDKVLTDTGTPEALGLRGKTGVANAKLAYIRFREIFSGEGFQELKRRGANIQRPLWASTGTKNPAYSDLLYVENLIGEHTITSMPPATLDAFRDHGQPRPTLETGLEEAFDVMASLERMEISLRSIAQTLLVEGVDSFSRSYDALLSALEAKRRQFRGETAA